MANATVPGLFNALIAIMLVIGALRSHYSYIKWQKAEYKISKRLCTVGAVFFFLIAILQVLESYGISFR